MPDYDGDIKLKVSLTPGDIKSTANSIKSALSNAFSGEDINELDSGLQKIVLRLFKIQEKADAVVSRMAELENTKINTEAYDAVTARMSEISRQMFTVEAEMGKLQKSGVSEDSSQYQQLVSKLQQLKSAYKNTAVEAQNLREAGLAYTTAAETEEYTKLSAQLNELNNQQVLLINQYENLNDEIGDSTISFDRLGRTGKTALNLLVIGTKRVISGLKSMVQHLKSSHKHSKGLGGSFKTLLRYGLGIRSLFVLFNRLRNAIKEGFNNLRQYDSALNGSLTAVSNATTQLKNSVAAAVSPLANALLPLLTTIISRISEAISLLGAFFAMLSGKSTFVKATKVQDGYADSLDRSAGSAKKLRAQLAGFDELNTLSSNDSGGGGGGGASAADMFTTEEIPVQIADFVNKLKEAWKQADFTDIGRIVGKKISDAFARIDQFITSDKVLDFVSRLVRSIATFFNGLGEGIEWETIGKTITDGLNLIVGAIDEFWSTLDLATWGKGIADALMKVVNDFKWETLGHAIASKINRLFDLAYNFLVNFDFRKFGTQIASSINEMIATINWEEVANTITEIVGGALEFLIGLVEGLDWKQLGEKVFTLLSEIDWNRIIEDVFELLGGVIGGLAAFFWEKIAEAWESIKAYFGDRIKKCGDDIVLGILSGIMEALVHIYDWIIQHIFHPIFDGIRRAFGISSPASTMKPIGGFIIDGLLGGITNALKSIGQWIKTNIFDKFISGVKTAFGIVGTVASKLKESGSSIVNGIKSGISEKWNTISTIFSTGIAGIKSLFTNGDWSSIGSNIVSGLKNGISNAWSSVTSTISSLSSSLVSKAKKALKIGSPSKIFEDEVGKMIPAGIAVGVDQGEKVALDSVTSMSDAMVKAATAMQIPDISAGKVLPYSMSNGNASNNTIIQELLSVLKSDDIMGVLSAMLTNSAQEISALKEQNDLLSKLLDKQLVVQPSAAFGRVVSQSMAQYGKVTGYGV